MKRPNLRALTWLIVLPLCIAFWAGVAGCLAHYLLSA
jgi:hypothetical protein